MARYFALSNHNILVNIDEHGQLRDFTYPYVGEENHLGGKACKLGVWVDGQFAWLADDSWEKQRSYIKDSLITKIIATNHHLGIELSLNDCIDREHNVLLRRVRVKNLRKDHRTVRIFFHQNFDILGDTIGDTVYYDPMIRALIHYKGRRYFLMNGQFYDKSSKRQKGFTTFTTGLTGEYGLEGTFVDAEDGTLSKNPIEHGSVDSVVGFECTINEQIDQEIYYWICVGENFGEVAALDTYVKEHKPKTIFETTQKYWIRWVNRTPFQYYGLSERVVDLFKRSLLMVSTHVDQHGAFIASSDSDMLQQRKDTYSYMWPRDGALIARSLDRAGYSRLTEAFFTFCCNSFSPEGWLFHKYRPDGSLGSSWHPWVKNSHVQLPIQEDQVALVIDAMWKHYAQHRNVEFAKRILPCVRKGADFMARFIDKKTGLPKETYDLWEEKLGVHTFTCAAVTAGLSAAAHFEGEFGTKARQRKYNTVANRMREAIVTELYDKEKKRFIKGLYYDDGNLHHDTTNDASSSYGVFQFGVLPADDERVMSSMDAFVRELRCNTAIGGYARYVDDYYYRVTKETPGNPWFITTFWLAEYYIARAKNQNDLKPAIDIFEWACDRALETGVLPEQLNPYTGAPLSVAPLTWSHAGYVIAINKYLEKLDQLGICEMCNPPKIQFDDL